MRITHSRLIALTCGLLTAGAGWAQDPAPSEEGLRNAFPQQASYSPYANRNFPTQVYWGETHLHTGLSLDAGLFGNTLQHDEAYRLARGEDTQAWDVIEFDMDD